MELNQKAGRRQGRVSLIIWFTRESWKYMAGRHRLARFLRGYPGALWGFMRPDRGGD